MFETISLGLLIALLWAAFGYALAKAKKEDETFEPAKFAKTLVIGIILASAAEGLGVTITEIEGMSTVGVLTIIVDKVAGLLLKASKKP